VFLRISSRRITVGADKAYDTKDFIAGARELNVTAHVQKNENGRRSNLDGRTTRHSGYLPVIRMSDGALRYRASQIDEFVNERERPPPLTL